MAVKYSPEFLHIWDMFPKRVGSNPKPRAQKAFNARLKEGADYEQMKAGTIKYLRFCVNTGKIKTEYIMQVATFFGPDCHYENEWECPKKNSNFSDGIDEAFG